MTTRFMLGLAAIATLGLVFSGANAAEDAAKKVEVKCPVSGKPIDKEHHVAYKGAEVYFCCPNCPKAFEKETAKYAEKANHQLVLTEQVEQKNCPFTGKPIDEAQSVMVADAEVHFCCANCKAKAEKASEKERMAMIFADKPFDKAYAVKKSDK